MFYEMQANGNKSFDANEGGSKLLGRIRRTTIVVAMVLLVTVSARATNWYVDNAVSGGSNNGTSWANAWRSIGSVSWSSVKPGDTVYISGGTSSQTYSEVLNSSSASGTSASPVTISVGQDAGHTGQVIIDATGQGYGVQLGSYQHLTGNVGGLTNFVVCNSTSSTDRTAGTGLYASGAVGLVINNVAVHTCNNGMTLGSPTPLVISNCYLYDIQGDHGIAVGGSTGGYDANLIHNCTVQVNGYMNGSTYGPDGIQGSDGVSVYNCNIYEALGTVCVLASPQHQDGVQFIGNYWKIYNNTFTDLGNSCCEGGCTATTVGYYMIYNNVMRTLSATVNVQRGVEWSPNSQCTVLTDVYICNNTVVDLYGYYAINWIWECSSCVVYDAAPTIKNFVVENNIYYNSMPPYVASESGASQSDLTFDYNAVYAGANGSSSFSVFGSAPSQPHLRSGNVQFASYSPRSSANDFHLKSTDTVALDQGTSLATLFTTDKDGISRPQGAAWDIGAFEYHTTSTNPVIAISPSSQSAGTISPGMTNSVTYTVQNGGGGTLSGSASVSSPFSIVSGGSYSLAAGQNQSVVVQYSPTVVGTNTQTVTFTGGGGATATVTGSAAAPLSGLVFSAGSGTITAPFVLTSGYISQPVQTGIPSGGVATYTFVITNAGNYEVQMLVNAPNDSANSLYVNIDGMPTDPYDTWQIPVTTNFQNEIVSWQGNGTYDAPQFVPQVFNLGAGTHQLVIVGREAGTEVQTISILSYSTNSGNTSPAISVTPVSQSFGTIAAGTTATNSFTVQNTGGGTLAGSASVAAPYSIVSGSSYSLAAGQTQTVTVVYGPTVAGTNNQTVTFTGGGGATVSVTGSATAVMAGLIFPAAAATLTSPFTLSNGYISQSIQTGVTNGGTATFTFSITNTGSYVIQALVNAPNDSANSLYVNIDAMPTDPYDTWQIPITTGFQNLVVSWQGTGTYDNSQFVPEIFNLTAGTHQLIFVGREAGTQLQQVSVLKIPSPPTGLHVVPGS